MNDPKGKVVLTVKDGVIDTEWFGKIGLGEFTAMTYRLRQDFHSIYLLNLSKATRAVALAKREADSVVIDEGLVERKIAQIAKEKEDAERVTESMKAQKKELEVILAEKKAELEDVKEADAKGLVRSEVLGDADGSDPSDS